MAYLQLHHNALNQDNPIIRRSNCFNQGNLRIGKSNLSKIEIQISNFMWTHCLLCGAQSLYGSYAGNGQVLTVSNGDLVIANLWFEA